MPIIGPIKHRDLIINFRLLGFIGPYSGRKHQFMRKGNQSIRLPNPHKSDISKDLLVRILRQADISREEWERL